MHKHRNSNDISSIATIEEEEEVSRNGIGNGIATSSSASSASGPARLHIRNQSNAHPEQRPRGVSLSRQTVLNRQRERGFSLSSSTSSQPGGGAFSSSRGRRTRRLRVFWTRHYRRILLAAFLSLLGWSLYTHRDEAIRDVTVLSKRSSGYAASLTGGGAAASKAALRARPASKRSTSDLPFARQEFRMQEPTYEILILQSTIQHQNTTWRQTVTQNGASWIVQSIGWIRVLDGGLRPETTSVAGWCKTPLPADIASLPEAERPTPPPQRSVKAEVKMLWTDYRDRGIDQDTILWIECDATPLLEYHLGRSGSGSGSAPDTAPSDDGVPAASALVEYTQEQVAQLRDVQFDFAFEHDLGTVETSTSGKVPLVQWYTAMDVDVQLASASPLDRVSMTACLSPAFYDGDRMPVLRWLEWREHMRRLGTERVVWYGRMRSMGRFVDEYNRVSGMKDVFRYAPPLGDQGSSLFSNPYHDQDAWYGECVLSHRSSSDYLLILDVDEYPMVDFDDARGLSPAEQWLRFMQSLPEDRGMWEMTRVPMSRQVEDGPPAKAKLVQDQYSCVNGFDTRVKSFYKANTTMTVNQHKKTRMYPLGAEIAKKIRHKADRKFWEQNWDSSIKGAWPKLFHYRWFEDDVENGCTRTSPLAASPGYATYLHDLRRDVYDKRAKIEKALGM